MVSIAVAFVIAFVLSMSLTPIVRQFALRLGIVDHPGRARKIHQRTTPRLGGLAIAAGFYAPLVVLLAVRTKLAEIFAANGIQVAALLAGGLAILGLGVYDDRRGANARIKFSVQLAVAVMLVMTGFTFTDIALPMGGTLHVGAAGSFIAILWIVGITNAVNLIDGLDGLAAGVVALVAGTMLVVAVSRGVMVAGLLNAALAGALIGFLVHNRHPATIFMGDTGSLFIGYIVAATALMTDTKSTTAVALLVPILALGLPIMDTVLATFRRLLSGRSPFTADQEHIHHRLLQTGLSHGRAVVAMWLTAAIACLGALGLVFTNGLATMAILIAYAVLAFVMVRKLGYLRMQRWGAEFAQGRRRKLAMATRQSHVNAVISAMPLLRRLDDLYGLLLLTHRVHRYDRVQLDVYTAGGERDLARSFVWDRDGSDREPHEPGVRVGFDLRAGTALAGRMEYFFPETTGGPEVEDEHLFGLLHESLAQMLVRLKPTAAKGLDARIVSTEYKADPSDFEGRPALEFVK